MEEWKPYEFYTSIYRVSNTGRIKQNKDGEDLHICPTNNAVWLKNRWRKRQISIVRLMAICFLGMPDDDKHIAYRLDYKKGYEIDNIAWGVKNEAQKVIAKQRYIASKNN